MSAPWQQDHHWVGRTIRRTLLSSSDDAVAEHTDALVQGWLPAEASEFTAESTGLPAPLWNVCYHTGLLTGDCEDLEEHEILESLFATRGAEAGATEWRTWQGGGAGSAERARGSNSSSSSSSSNSRSSCSCSSSAGASRNAARARLMVPHTRDGVHSAGGNSNSSGSDGGSSGRSAHDSPLPAPGTPTTGARVSPAGAAAGSGTAYSSPVGKSGYRGGQRSPSSDFHGVSWYKRDKKWQAYIGHDGKKVHLGSFSTAEQAARAYDAKASELKGAAAILNYPDKGGAAAAKGNQGHRASSSDFHGVSWYKRDKKWQAYIRHDGKKVHLGSFSTAEQAARAYDARSRALFGADAVLNFSGGGREGAVTKHERASPAAGAGTSDGPDAKRARHTASDDEWAGGDGNILSWDNRDRFWAVVAERNRQIAALVARANVKRDARLAAQEASAGTCTSYAQWLVAPGPAVHCSPSAQHR